MLQLPWWTDPVHAHHGDRQPRPPHTRPRHRRLPHLLLQQRLRTGQLKNQKPLFWALSGPNPYFSVDISRGHYTVKKWFTSFPSPAGMSLTINSPGQENSVMTSLFPPRESLVVTSRLGTGNSRTFFYGVHTDKKENQIFLIYKEIQSGAVAKWLMR